jgi:hypothetical protein
MSRQQGVVEMRNPVVIFFCVLFISGCGMREMRVPAQSAMVPDARPPGNTVWPGLDRVKTGDTIAIYLQNGRRFEHHLRGPDAAVDLDMNGIRQEHVVAISQVRRDRLLDGVLTGMAAGTGVGMAYGKVLSDNDFSGAIAAVAGIYGIAAGAGIGAMLDAGFASPEKPLYVKPTPGLVASSPKRWNLAVSAADLTNWVAGRDVELMLKNGTWIKARVKDGDRLTLRLDVRDSSDRSRKGENVTVAAEDVGAVAFRENIGGNRASASIGGALTGFFAATLLAGAYDDAADEKPLVIGAGLGLVLGAVTGLGLAEHHNWRELTLSVR